MKSKISKALTKGLLTGYAGKGDIYDVTRSFFHGKSSHFEDDEIIYRDEWFVPSHLGGGQEMVKVEEEKFTRLYAGGSPPKEVLDTLGIMYEDVSNYLIRKIKELGNKTRLFEECIHEEDGDWQYRYEILFEDTDIGVTVGVETITFKGTRVHLHPFILSPVG